MDVRCDRCETEYELDDSIVTDAGASVQCTTCGHTFIVTRRPSSPLNQVGLTPPGGITDGPGPEVPEWTLSADDGKVHRFRDLNVLQKWIVERKVTRSDQISRSGGPWLSLGDVVELSPFFKVVDEADRARATTSSSPSSQQMTNMPGMVAAAQSRSSSGPIRAPGGANSGPIGVSTPPPVPSDARRPVSEDGPTVPNRLLPGIVESGSIPKPGIRPPDSRVPTPRVATDARLPGMGGGSGGASARATGTTPRPPARTEIVFGPNITAEMQALDADFLQPSKRGRNVAFLLVAVVAAAGSAGYWWWTQQQLNAARDDSIAAGAPSSTVGTVGTVGTVANPAGHADVPAASGADVLPAPGASAGDRLVAKAANGNLGASGAAAPSEHAPANAVGAGAGGATAGRGHASATTPARPGRGTTPNAAPVRTGGAYEKLVNDADRLLDKGKSAKADKLYAQALVVRPDGVAALTGAAYVLLDRQRHFKAIETFRRALAIQPSYGPALFGIAESYRARGDSAQALGAYRQYLATTPAGADAPAARRQIKDLESGSGTVGSAGDGTTSGPPPGDE